MVATHGLTKERDETCGSHRHEVRRASLEVEVVSLHQFQMEKEENNTPLGSCSFSFLDVSCPTVPQPFPCHTSRVYPGPSDMSCSCALIFCVSGDSVASPDSPGDEALTRAERRGAASLTMNVLNQTG